jgi:filamentous hemagglutinin family protein
MGGFPDIVIRHRRARLKTRALGLSIIASLLLPCHVSAQIVTDGSVGPAVDFGVGDAVIPSTIGATRGANLFHSFSTFNINLFRTVQFIGPGQFDNVVARVTGGLPSLINGTLRSQIGDNGLFLVNPAGVVFGPGAQLDVPAAFHASDAATIDFVDGARFEAANPAANGLTAAAPTAFGFLDAGAGGLTVNNASIIGSTIVDLSASGGISVQNAVIGAFGNNVRIQAVEPGGLLDVINSTPRRAPGAEPVDITSSTLGALPGQLGIGGNRVEISASSIVVDASSGGVAGLTIAAENIVLANSGLASENGSITLQFASADLNNVSVDSSTGNFTAGGSVTFQGGDLTIAASTIETNTSFLGPGGAIVADVENLRATNTSFQAISQGFAPGGDIMLSFATMEFSGSLLATAGFHIGSGGAIWLQGDSATISGGQLTPLQAFASIASDAINNAAGGNIVLEIDAFTLTDTNISSLSFGAGPGGHIDIVFDTLVLERTSVQGGAGGSGRGGDITLAGNVARFSGLSGLSGGLSTLAFGAGGDIVLNVEEINLGPGSSIQFQSTRNSAGAVTIRGETLSMQGTSTNPATIAALGSGVIQTLELDVTSIQIGANSVILLQGQAGGAAMAVTSDAFETASGSTVVVSALGGEAEFVGDLGSFIIGGQFVISSAAINSNSRLVVVADTFNATATSLLGVASGTGGSPIAILDIGSTAIFQSDFVVGDVAGLNLNNGVGDVTGGELTITAGVAISIPGRVSAIANGDGDGGRVALQAPSIIVDGGFVTVRTENGGPGSLSIDAVDLVLRGGAIIDAETGGTGDGGRINIQAEHVSVLAEAGQFTAILSTSDPQRIDVLPDGTPIIVDGQPSDPAGHGGSVQILTDVLEVHGGVISALTAARGGGGNIDIVADQVFLSDQGVITARSIGFGDGGDVSIHATELVLRGLTRIDSLAESLGNSGTVTIAADNITLANGAEIATFSSFSGGGQITITDTEFLFLDNGFITSSVFNGAGNGGNIDVHADRIVLLPNASITANAFQGQGGALSITTDGLFQTLGTRITASSTLGIDGTVNIAGPQNPETVEVAGLPSDFLAVNAVLKNPCLAALIGRSELTGSGSNRAHRLDSAPAGLMLDHVLYPASDSHLTPAKPTSTQLANLNTVSPVCGSAMAVAVDDIVDKARFR